MRNSLSAHIPATYPEAFHASYLQFPGQNFYMAPFMYHDMGDKNR